MKRIIRWITGTTGLCALGMSLPVTAIADDRVPAQSIPVAIKDITLLAMTHTNIFGGLVAGDGDLGTDGYLNFKEHEQTDCDYGKVGVQNTEGTLCGQHVAVKAPINKLGSPSPFRWQNAPTQIDINIEQDGFMMIDEADGQRAGYHRQIKGHLSLKGTLRVEVDGPNRTPGCNIFGACGGVNFYPDLIFFLSGPMTGSFTPDEVRAPS